MDVIKVKTFSKYKLLNLHDLHQKIYNYLIAKDMMFCFLEDGTFISRENCLKYNIKK